MSAEVGHAEWNARKLRLEYHYPNNFTPFFNCEALLWQEKTAYQMVRVVRTKEFGKCLICNDDVMGAQSDESYDMAYLRLAPYPIRKVAILGGGDCSLAWQVRKQWPHAQIVVLEIDRRLVDICAKYFVWPEACGATFLYGDAFKRLPELAAWRPDVVFDDMVTEPYQAGVNYYQRLTDALPNVPIVSQVDSVLTERNQQCLKAIAECAHVEEQLTVFVPSFYEEWTFARYRGNKEIR